MTLAARIADLAAAVRDKLNAHHARIAALEAGGGGGGADPWSYVTLAADVATTLTTLSDVADLTFAAAANTTYRVELFGSFQTAATATGLGIGLDVPADAQIMGMTTLSSSNTALQHVVQRADDVIVAPSSAVGAANTAYPLWGGYDVIVGATGGDVMVRIRTEVSGSAATLRAGTRLGWRVLA
jgi:hypothetical protein